MVIWIDCGFLLVVALIIIGGAAGTIADWVVNHILIVILFLIGKTMFFFAGSLFKKNAQVRYYAGVSIIILLDIIRNGFFFFCILQMLGDMMSGGLFNFFMGILDVLFGGTLLFLAAEGPMYFVYDELGFDTPGTIKGSIFLEIVSIVAMILIAWWGGVWG